MAPRLLTTSKSKAASTLTKYKNTSLARLIRERAPERLASVV
ncbi:hypothetical protein ABIF91_001991 [Bradyrhizobium sp. USDA 241]